MKRVFVSLGSNLGDRHDLLLKAVGMIGASAGKIVSCSSVYETESVGFSGGDFLNLVLCIETELQPSGLIGRFLRIESELGRIRCQPGYESRTMDIDILLLGDEILDTEYLVIPHPRMHLRRFVLEPLCEIAPGLIHPLIGQTVKEILLSCPDSSRVTLSKTQINPLSAKL
jgi:deoxyguanosine kinase